MVESIGNRIIVGVASAIGTAAVLWGVAQTGGLIKQVFIPDLPGGAVVAFDGKCPESDGWVPYQAAEGRFLLGVGQGPLAAPVHAEQPGGAEKHTLTIEEMPQHDHAIQAVRLGVHGGDLKIADAGDWHIATPENVNPEGEWVNHGSGDAGGNQPHNNMPPYIALHFCKKEAG